MRKALVLSIITITLILSSLFLILESDTVSASFEESNTLFIEQNELKKIILNQNDVMHTISFLEHEGNSVVIYGLDIDHELVYDQLLKEHHIARVVPYGSKVNTTAVREVEAKKSKAVSIENTSTQIDHDELQPTMNLNQSRKSSIVAISVVNSNGELKVMSTNISFPIERNISDILSIENVLELVKSEEYSKKILEYKNILNNTDNQTLSTDIASNENLITSLRTHDIYWDYYPATRRDVIVAEHTTDYYFYNANSQDKSSDHIIVKTHTLAKSGRYIQETHLHPSRLVGVQSNVSRFYNDDYLQTWQPNTNGIHELMKNEEYSYSIGYPFAVTIDFTWAPRPRIEMLAVGNKTDWYYQFFRTTRDDDFSDDREFTFENASQWYLDWTMFDDNFTNHHFRGIVSTQFANVLWDRSGYEWHSNAYELYIPYKQ